CRQADVRPIVGMTLRVAPPSGVISAGLSVAASQLVLLADGPAGYRSLCRLSSFIQGRPERESVAARGLNWDELKSSAEGLICLSGGRLGWLERFVRAGDQLAARRYAARLGGIFGENAYLSLEIHNGEDREIATEIVDLGQRFGLPPVACQPVLCLEEADYPRLRLLAAIDRNCSLEEVISDETLDERIKDRHWQRPEDIAERFVDFPESLANAGQIIERCQPALPDGRPIWPVLHLPEVENEAQMPDDHLARQAEAGMLGKYGPEISAEIKGRLQKELAAIAQSGYAPLFLIVADVVRFARQKDIPVSTRGSVANSLVAYCLDITTVDPIVHDLLFERFLNPARANPPDIDLDFCSRRRDEVLAYVRQAYDPDKVALVATVSTLRPKSAVRETGKVYGLTETEINQLVKQLPRGWHPDPRRRSKGDMADLLDKVDDPRQVEVIVAAKDIVGQPHHLSIHPGGVVITPGPLTDHVPVQWAPKGFLITQFGHEDLETLGLPKLDLLGIRALTVLADAAELVRRYHDPSFRLADIPLDDPTTANSLSRGDTIGVFQCESAGARRTLRQLRARTVFDLAVANAFFKPGPATGGMARSFVRRYRGEEAVSYLHPALVPILGATKGVLLFQEQILRVATEIAGLSWEQADHLRRGMSKFKADEMAAMQSQFEAGCRRPAPEGPGFSQEQAKTLWEQVLAFAGYGFNRGHATAYADVSYRSAYLKSHWPAAFFSARLADWGGFHHPAIYMAEAIRLGIPVRPPHVNYSNRAFTLSYSGQWSVVSEQWPARSPQPLAPGPQSPIPDRRSPVLFMGLGQVRDLRRRSVRQIIAAREKRSFVSLQDLAERVPLQGKELRHLVQCGALDDLGENRAALLAEAELVNRAGSARQMTFDFTRAEVEPESAADRLEWERRLLGQPISVHPLDLVSNPPEVTPLAQLASTDQRRSRELLTVAGARLPGWTGGPGFFLGDGRSFIIVRGDDGLQKPEPWLPLWLRGRWLVDEWGSGWLQIEETALLF
ncbi:MAG TPA: DNA polymerase III subunit alpha, partial [Anaerolineae bacterium]|nr:DNA polymerase III subunit alpha [Anaerolineae bacterium]